MTQEEEIEELFESLQKANKTNETLIKLLKKSRKGWIPVSKRLPEGIGTYLVTIEYKEHGRYATTLWYHGKEIGWDSCCTDEIVAWMPLPEPYAEKEG